METKAGFDLNQSLRQWRDALAQSATMRAEELDELEHHLRDSMAQLRERQLSEEESFLIATRRLGGGEVLAREFVKANPSRVWPSRLCWMLAGIFFFQFLTTLPGVIINQLPFYAPAWLNGHWIGLISIAIQWAALLVPFAFILWLTTSKTELLARWTSRCARHPVIAAFALMLPALVLLLASALASFVFVRHWGSSSHLSSPEALTRFTAYTIWRTVGFTMLGNILLPVTLVYLVRRAMRSRFAK